MKSIEFFEQAIIKDRNYALSYVWLAKSYHAMGTLGFLPMKEAYQNVEWAARKALKLDFALADAHAYLGWSKYNHFDWAGAEKEIRRAFELNPHSSKANHAQFHSVSSTVGPPNFGRQIRVWELDPIYSGAHKPPFILEAQFALNAIWLYRQEVGENPSNAAAHCHLGEAYIAEAMYEEGIAEMEKAVALEVGLDENPERCDRYPMLAFAYAVGGKRRQALKILDEQKRLAKQRYVSPDNFAIIYAGLGDKDRAFEWLEKSYEDRTRLILQLISRPMFDSLRSDPRYADLLRRMGLEPAAS